MKLVGKIALIAIAFLVIESAYSQVISWPPGSGGTTRPGTGGPNIPLPGAGTNKPKQPKKPSAGKAPKLSTQTLWTLKKKSMKINTLGAVTIIRTAKSPTSFKIKKTYQYEKKYCARYAQRQRCGQDGFKCGYTQQCGMGPGGQPICRQGMPRSCCWVENDCVQYDFVKSIDEDTLNLKFNKPYKLTGAETETFQVVENVKKPGSKSVIFEIKEIDTVGRYEQKRNKKLLGGLGNNVTLTPIDEVRNFPGTDDPVENTNCDPKNDKKCTKSSKPKKPKFDDEL